MTGWGREEGLDGGGGGALGDGEELGSVDDETFIYRLIHKVHRHSKQFLKNKQ